VREPALGLKTSLLNGGSFLKRIHENLGSIWKLPWAPLPAAHAPLHMLDRRSVNSGRASQLGSALLHVCLCAALLGTAARTPVRPPLPRAEHGWSPLPPVPKWLASPATGTLGKTGESGGPDNLPATLGELPPESRVALLRPHLSDSRPHPLAVQVTIANPEAPEFVRTTNDLGLPGMPARNGSEGTGENGIGKGRNYGAGKEPGEGSGVGKETGPYGPVASHVICRVCPDPLYSEEARKTKLQGLVALSVLVGADGRAREVRVLHGLGMRLDENAAEAVRSWQFIPAKDASGRPVASWIKVETIFRLF
jgi:periplasmic protein TonB